MGNDVNHYTILKNLQNAAAWNKWRKENDHKCIFLRNSNFYGMNLQSIDFAGYSISHARRDLSGNLLVDHSEEISVHLENSDFRFAKLTNARFFEANANYSNFIMAHLENARFNRASLENTDFSDSYLHGTIFYRANLRGAKLRSCIVDGETSFWEALVDKKTDTRGIDLENCRIDIATKTLLKYNNRRLNWEDWYNDHPIARWPAKWFWWLSDYGKSPKKLFNSFVFVSFIYSIILTSYEYIFFYPSQNPPPETWPYSLSLLDHWYTAIVTMVTLGSYPEPSARFLFDSYLSALLIIVSYFILAALVAYIGILYTSDGPPGLFAEEIEKRKLWKKRWSDLRRMIMSPAVFFKNRVHK